MARHGLGGQITGAIHEELRVLQLALSTATTAVKRTGTRVARAVCVGTLGRLIANVAGAPIGTGLFSRMVATACAAGPGRYRGADSSVNTVPTGWQRDRSARFGDVILGVMRKRGVDAHDLGAEDDGGGATPTTTGERLTDQVFVWLTDQIVRGGLRPGEWISESRVAIELGVSRSPVHQALQVLAATRVVEVVPRRGTKIANPTAGEVEETYRAREFVDGEVTYLATRGRSPELSAQLLATTRALAKARGHSDLHFDLMERVWTLLRDACGNAALADASVMLGRRSIPIRGLLLRTPGVQEVTYSLAHELAQAVAAGDAGLARKKAIETLRASREYALEYCFPGTRDGTSPRRRPSR